MPEAVYDLLAGRASRLAMPAGGATLAGPEDPDRLRVGRVGRQARRLPIPPTAATTWRPGS